MLNEDEEDDVSFYVQKNESTLLKSVSGLNIHGNLAEDRIKTNREPPTGKVFQHIHPSILFLLSFVFGR
jgi:hypothetical protein